MTIKTHEEIIKCHETCIEIIKGVEYFKKKIDFHDKYFYAYDKNILTKCIIRLNQRYDKQIKKIKEFENAN